MSNEKDIKEIAINLYELVKDMDFNDYAAEKENIINDLENAIFYIKTIAKNEYNADYFRTFYNILNRI